MAKQKRDRRIKLSDEQLLELVQEDISAAEGYFNTRIKTNVIARYNLLHTNDEYYKELFPKLCEKIQFSSSDIRDAVEWMMPSLIESFFGPDRIVGVLGRTPDDNPEPLEKTIEYQINSQNDGYEILSQWIRDALEAGLGAIFCDWLRLSEIQTVEKEIPESEFAKLPEEALKRVKSANDLGDGRISVGVQEEVRTTDKPIIRNLQPGAFVWIPDKDSKGRHLFEAVREYVPIDDLRAYEKAGIFRNVDKIDIAMAQAETGKDAAGSLGEILDAITNYEGEGQDNNGSTSIYGAQTKDGQDGRKMVLRYICFGKYDVNGDGLLEWVRVTVCGGVVLSAEIDEFNTSPIRTISVFPNSYQRWKQAVADFLQSTQDLKTALIMQIIANVAYNNDRPVLIDDKQSNGIAALEAGRKAVPLKTNGQNIDQIAKPMPENQISEHAWPLMEYLTMAAENKVGVSRQTQGLDGDTLAKMTAFGVGKVMGAQQQRLRLLVRNAAQTGMIRLYERLIELDQAYLDKEVIVRLTGQYYTFAPDDFKGKFDTQVVSNIGLNNKEATISSLMVLFKEILPPMMQIGVANPKGVYATAKKLIEQMGFPSASALIGATEEEIIAKMQQQNVIAQLPQLLAGLFQQAGIAPEQAAMVIKGLSAAMSPQQGQTQPSGAPANG